MSTSTLAKPIAVILLSGGLDSFVSGALAREVGYELIALTIDYGQRHRIELGSATSVAKALGVSRHIVLPLALSKFGGSALTADIPVPKKGMDRDIPVTYVPARNTIFLALTLGLAEASRARDIYIGVNTLDYSGYPDCRPEFIAAFQHLAELATKRGVEGDKIGIRAPLQHMTKAQITLEAERLGLNAGISWSCYDPALGERPGQWVHCGHCDACRLRHKGYREADIADPTIYAYMP